MAIVVMTYSTSIVQDLYGGIGDKLYMGRTGGFSLVKNVLFQAVV